MSVIQVELLREAYAIFDGMPAGRIDLNVIVAGGSINPVSCGTVACGMGWLAMHPYFNSLGLTYYDGDNSRFSLAIQGRPMSYAAAAARIFGFKKSIGVDMFAPWSTHLDRPPNMRQRVNDKARLLNRIKTFLRSLDEYNR